jgi:hypothetical protein
MEVCMMLEARSRLVAVAIASLFGVSVQTAQAHDNNGRCVPVGGTFQTNVGVIDGNTTLGTATGDLKGAVAATILSVAAGKGGTTVFTVQHHLVTESGDTIAVDVAKATAMMVAPGLFAIVSYPIKIVGGTGRFDGATGHIENIGEVDLNVGRTVFRYAGKVCFADHDE